MRIGIDAIHISRNRKGVGRVERSIIRNLARMPHDHQYVVFLNSDHTSLRLKTSASVTYASARARNLLAWEQFQLPRLSRRYEVDCMLSLSDRIPWARDGNVLMYLFEIPDYRANMALAAGGVGVYQRASDFITRAQFPYSLKRVRHIAVASSSTGNDLRNHYHVPERKITVVPAAADSQFEPQLDPARRLKTRESYSASAGYVLHFATGDLRDNTAAALQAFARARIPSTTKMVLAGCASSVIDKLKDDIIAMQLSERVLLVGYLDERELVELYQAASAYLDPSLYEGFGLQVLEAMACGVPVVCSNTTSLPEIVGDAAITCDPDDPAAFSAGLEAVLNHPDRLAIMRTAGIRQAGNFSWQRTTGELIRLCELAVTR